MTGPEFDPRYDARYQRGWVAGPTGAAAPAGADAGPEPAAGRPADAGHDGIPEIRAQPGASVPSGTGPKPGTEARHAEDRHAAPDPTPTVDAASSVVRPDVHDDRVARIMRVALGIAWAVALAATVVGGALIWRLATLVPRYDAPRDAAEMMLESLSQGVAPSLVSAGLLGVVVLTLVDGLRRAFPGAGQGVARAQEPAMIRALLDRSVLALAALAVAAGIAIWRFVSWRVEAEQIWAEIQDSPPTPEQQQLLQLFDLVPYVLSPPAATLFVAALVGLPVVVGARYAAIVRTQRDD